MKKVFVKKADLVLVNGGYVVTGEDKTPVYNSAFMLEQQQAHALVVFAEQCKGKDFVGKKADSIEAVKRATIEALGNTATEYVKNEEAPKTPTADKLKKEALSFLDFGTSKDKTKRINEAMQKFNTVNEFEEFGLYFTEDVVKLNKIYTVKEILAAVTATIELQD